MHATYQRKRGLHEHRSTEKMPIRIDKVMHSLTAAPSLTTRKHRKELAEMLQHFQFQLFAALPEIKAAAAKCFEMRVGEQIVQTYVMMPIGGPHHQPVMAVNMLYDFRVILVDQETGEIVEEHDIKMDDVKSRLTKE
jgi:hypothetical protein